MSLEDRLNGEAQTWRPLDNPDHPRMLIGEIIEIETGTGDYGEYPIITILDEKNNEWRWSVFGGVAQGKIATLNPQIGDKIGAKYLGEKPSPTRKNKDGTPKMYYDWKIVLDRVVAITGTATPQPTPVAIAQFGDDEF